jgi:hypothetical protein
VRKIPTIFVRDLDDRSTVTDEWHPDCLWVRGGEGVATGKVDGTAVTLMGGSWWCRREVKPGKTPPPGFAAEETDSVTGKTVGWEPAVNSGYAAVLDEALRVPVVDPAYAQPIGRPVVWTPNATYELVGPKVNGNPHRLRHHELWPHGRILTDVTRTRPMIRAYLEDCPGWEGIVFWHPDGRRAKIKRRDLGLEWPS